MQMSTFLRRFLLCGIWSFLALMTVACEAQQPKVLVSVTPLYYIAKPLLNNVVEPELLIPPQMSPHLYTLKPSDMLRLQQAELFIWLGDALERPLQRSVKKKQYGRTVSLLNSHELQWLHYADKDEAHEDEHLHGHEHGAIDPHIWFDPMKVRIIAQQLAKQFCLTYPKHVRVIEDNLHLLLQRLERLDSRIRMQLSDSNTGSIFIDHNFLNYYVTRYQLNIAGDIASLPSQAASVRKMMQIRQQLLQQNVRCFVADKQSPNPVMKKLVSLNEGSRLIEIDPLGAGYITDEQAYFKLLDDVTTALSQCFATP